MSSSTNQETIKLPLPLLVTAFCLLASGCGFQPLYGKYEGSKENPLLAGVTVNSVAQNARMAQMLRTNLEDRLNPDGVVPANAPYRLEVSLGYSEAPIGTARDGTVSRYNVYLNSNYNLYRVSDGKRITSGNLYNVSGYNNIINQYFATYVADEDAIRRGIVELAELYRQRLGAYLTVNPEGTATAAAEKSQEEMPVFVPASGEVPMTPGARGFYQNQKSPYYENRFP